MTTAWLLVCALLVATPLRAQEVHVAGAAAMQQAMADKTHRDDARRQMILAVLHRPDVQVIASRMGLSITRADAAVRSLDGADLERAAQVARTADADLAGGASTVTISITTLLLLLILIVLLVK